MSPGSQICGATRQRGAIGLMAAMTLSLALVLMLLVIDTGRLYMEQRKLQRVVDTAALEAVSRGGTCLPGLTAASYASQSATRNGFTVDANDTLSTTCGTLLTAPTGLRTFNVDATQSVAIKVVASRSLTTSFAGAVQALFSGTSVSLNTQLNASAVAAKPQSSIAQLSIRSTLVSVSTAQSNILNPLFSGLLGGNVSLTTAGWTGLLNTNIDLLDYLNQLAINLNVTAGNYSQLLNTQASVTQLIQAAATVVQLNGATADVLSALGNLQVAAINASPVKLGDILQLQTGTAAAGLDANIQLLQLMQAVVQLANANSAVAATLPVSVLGLVNVTVRVKVIEPPQLSAIGDPALAKASPLGPNRIYVRTAQVRTMLSVNLPVLTGVPGLANAVLGLVGPLTPTLNGLLGLNLAATLNSAACLLGAGCQQLDPILLPSPEIDISLDAGGAISYVTDYSCPVGGITGSKSLTARTVSSIADLKLGTINPVNAFSSLAEPTVTPLPLIDIGIWTCHQVLGVGSCGPARTAFAAGGIAIMANTSVGNNTQDLVFSSTTPFATPPNLKLPPSIMSVAPTNNIVASLANTLSGINLVVYQPVGGNPLGAAVAGGGSLINGVSAILQPLITNLVSPLLDPLLNNLLNNLGINLMDVDVGANMTCGQTGVAYLVI
ncbi:MULTISPECIES: pilus assembly protein TadG-related protein [unclassified Pseudomonas]|uniref:pilus assembly protein TadG-related protein n=1 Tax=unclassified Pseudomonas TaxID=196821 RepID=UPI002AC9CD15|nr:MULTISPECIES: pilus assembly protein TadG-related protein [unclassified Pseudomonas]MEB0046883.1 pilus assembly protein TadG-related protein [Pseudomonas sp. Dout3]MEB0098641.1 pilus assembly protein TadG-related protein [Pseudomonas sp. DC1.2]WPX59607.1 pilus assembly protein TadG-related protein [Pseudomonas sp. DC1.2]